MTTESTCLAGRNNIKKIMSYKVIDTRFIPNKLIKLSSLLTMTNELLWPTEYMESKGTWSGVTMTEDRV